MEAKPSEEMFPVIAKMHAHSLLSDLVAFFKSRKACREYIFLSAKVTHETRELTESSMFCKLLFPEDKVEEVLKRAAKDNRSLLSKWGMSSQKRHLPGHLAAQSPSFPTPSTPAHKRKKSKHVTSHVKPQQASTSQSTQSSSASSIYHGKQNEAAHATFRKSRPSGSRRGRGRGSRRPQQSKDGDSQQKL